MFLASLSLKAFRCFDELSFSFSTPLTFLAGKNGSGKTAILEAIHLLGTGHSFTTRLTKPLVKTGSSQLVVRGLFDDGDSVGVLKGLQGQYKIKVNQHEIMRTSELASRCAMVVFDPSLMVLMDGSPEYRRNLLHWGMFHVKHDYHQYWLQYQLALKQRNALLKQAINDNQQFVFWERQMVTASLFLEALHQDYLSELSVELSKILTVMDFPIPLLLDYRSGWPRHYHPLSENQLLSALVEQRVSDLASGYTQKGIHRCDLLLKCGDYGRLQLSRGQKKLAAIILRLAQTRLISKPCIMLMDDIHAELSNDWFMIIIRYLIKYDAQIFMTSLAHHVMPGLETGFEWVYLGK